MRNRIINFIETALAHRDNEYFTREQDIQIYLAKYLSDTNEFDRISIEYHIPFHMLPQYPWVDSNNIYIDLVVEKNNLFYPIEIKYKTTTQSLPLNIFGTEGCVVLGHHGAQNIGCYDFWKDIRRLELYEQNFANVERGIMLFVSNDESYIQPPLNVNTGYAQFSIHEGKVVNSGEMLNWNRVLTISANRPPITFNNTYNLTWNDLNLTQHKYLLL
jgi:hypothetical protein